MAAGLGFKDFVTGEVLTAADVDGYLMQGIWVFASTAARDAAVTSPQEGNFAFTKDTNSLWYYDGAAWVASGATGDIEGVTAGIGISGGGTSGTVTVTNSMATAFTTSGDLIQATGSGTFARLGTGTNGQYLTTNGTTNSWGTISAGGMTLISTTTLSGATVTLSSIPQTYNNLQLVISGMNWNTSNAQPSIQFNGVTGNFYYSGTIGSAVHYRSNSTFWLTDNDWTRTNTTNSTVFNLYNYASTTTYKSFDYRGKNDQPTGGTRAFQFGGNWNDDTAAISSISIYAGGNTFAGGTVLLYGVK